MTVDSSAAVAQAYRITERWGLRKARVWAMERVLQSPPSRFGLPLILRWPLATKWLDDAPARKQRNDGRFHQEQLLRSIGLLSGGDYAERAYGR
jgi:hypothetical protein